MASIEIEQTVSTKQRETAKTHWKSYAKWRRAMKSNEVQWNAVKQEATTSKTLKTRKKYTKSNENSLQIMINH